MISRTRSLSVRAPLGLVAVLLLSTSSVEAHGGGGHGGGGHAAGHAAGASSHHSAANAHPGMHGGGGSPGQAASSYSPGPLTFNPYDLPAARMQRYFQHLFGHDHPAGR